MNKYLATVDFVLGDKTYRLNYNYEAIAEVLSKFGKEVLNTLYELSPNELAEILAIGLKADNVSAKQIMEHSPPIFATCKLIDEALGYAYFGPEGPPKVKSEDGKKKP